MKSEDNRHSVLLASFCAKSTPFPMAVLACLTMLLCSAASSCLLVATEHIRYFVATGPNSVTFLSKPPLVKLGHLTDDR